MLKISRVTRDLPLINFTVTGVDTAFHSIHVNTSCVIPILQRSKLRLRSSEPPALSGGQGLGPRAPVLCWLLFHWGALDVKYPLSHQMVTRPLCAAYSQTQKWCSCHLMETERLCVPLETWGSGPQHLESQQQQLGMWCSPVPSRARETFVHTLSQLRASVCLR